MNGPEANGSCPSPNSSSDSCLKIRETFVSLLGLKTVTKLHRRDENEAGIDVRTQLVIEMSEFRALGDEYTAPSHHQVTQRWDVVKVDGSIRSEACYDAQ